MLTREHAIYERKNGFIIPDRLDRKTHGHYIGFAERMLEFYRNGKGKTRKELHKQVEKLFSEEPDCPSKRIESFCKLLDDVSVFDKTPWKKAPNLRINVWKRAAEFHPLMRESQTLYGSNERDVKNKISEELKMKWEEIEEAFFADVADYHRLKAFEGYERGEDLLSRYNVAQCQAVLFRAVNMVVTVESDFKTVLTYAKLAKLLHTIQQVKPGQYRILFDGPASVLRNTRRYGINMANFLPSLLSCSNWEMEAKIQSGRKNFNYKFQLSHLSKLRSRQASPEEFDSSVEAAFAEKWGDQTRDGWRLIREGEILHHYQKVFIPDFVLEHESGQRVLLEIVGFWTPEYLKKKFQALEYFKKHKPLIAIAEANVKNIPDVPENAILFKTSLALKDVLEKLNEYISC